MATEASRLTWYAGLVKPFLNPPAWIFAPIWTLLYLLIAFVGWRLWDVKHSEKIRLRLLFTFQLFLNGIWSFLFFYARSPFAAFIDILFLWGVLFALMKCLWRVDRLAGQLLIPYMIWLSFAVYLNGGIWWLNH